jgi:hypothetical protein
MLRAFPFCPYIRARTCKIAGPDVGAFVPSPFKKFTVVKPLVEQVAPFSIDPLNALESFVKTASASVGPASDASK